jgi:flagellar hook-associated protein 1 FlgK
MGLSTALATAGRSLEVFSAGLQIAGQNISNASTPGYIREKLVLTTDAPFRDGNLLFGTGVVANGVRQQIDKFLATRTQAARSDFEGASARASIFKQLESTLNELGDRDLSSSLNNFLSKINDVTNQPEVQAVRQVAIGAGQQFASDVSALRAQIDQLRAAQTIKVKDLVTEANQLIDTIAQLNPQIVSLESAGKLQSDAGGLRTQRYAALNRLAEIIPIKAIEQANGNVDVFTDSNYLILDGNNTQKLQTTTSVDRGVAVVHVQIQGSDISMNGSGGELNGIISGRDTVLGGFADQLDTYAANVIYEFNKIHAAGEGVAGFSSVTGTYKVSDVNQSLNAAGLAFTPQHGSFDVKVINKQTGIAQTTTISIYLDGIGSDTTLQGLQTALAGVGNITASLTTDRRLTISAGAGYEIKFGNDSSGALAALGINTFFKGSTSQDIAVNSTVRDNANLFASGQGGGPADSSNVVKLARFVDQPVAGLGQASLSDFYDNTVSTLAQDSAAEEAVSQGFQGFRDALQSQQTQFSGVSLDEETINALGFQRNYQTAAKFVTVIDQLFEVLLNI